MLGSAESFHQGAPAGFLVQGYPLGVVPPLADPPAKTPAAEVDVPGELCQNIVWILLNTAPGRPEHSTLWAP